MTELGPTGLLTPLVMYGQAELNPGSSGNLLSFIIHVDD